MDMNKIFKIMATFVAAASVIGCTDTDELEKRIDNIDAVSRFWKR